VARQGDNGSGAIGPRRTGLFLFACVAFAGLLVPSAAPAAQAYNADCQMRICGWVSEDGTRTVFPFYEELTPRAGRAQVYERAGGVTKALVPYPSDPPDPTYAAPLGISADAEHVFLWTNLALAPGDDDGNTSDVYDLSNGTETLLSTGPLDDQSSYSSGPGSPFMMTFEGASADGSRVFLQSLFSPVVPEDTDRCPDLYERFAGRTTLVSTGPTATPAFPPGTCDLVRFGGLSADGSRVFFSTHDALVPGDEGDNDLYERAGSTVTLLTTYPDVDGGCIDTPEFGDSSADGRTVLFSTNIRVVPEDQDRTGDVYKRNPDGSFVLVSRGTEGPPVGGGCAMFEGDTPVAISADGGTAVFSTRFSLSPEDRDSSNDLYSVAGAGAPTLVSTGPTDPNTDSQFQRWPADVSDDATRVAFETDQSLLAEDTDHRIDVYLRSPGSTELISTGPEADGGERDSNLVGISGDGRTVAFATSERMTGEDTDQAPDIYVRQVELQRLARSRVGTASKLRGGSARTMLVSAESIAPRMRIARRGRLLGPRRGEIRLGCPKSEKTGPCHGSVVVRSHGSVAAKGGFTIRAGARRPVRLRLRRRVDARFLAVRVEVRGYDRLGNGRAVGARILLRGPRLNR
jgi:hypothetical protein